MWSSVMAVLLSTVLIVAWMMASMLSERWMSLEDGCVRHRLIRASTVATRLWEMASAPSCHLPGQSWIVKEYLRHLS